MLKYLLILDFPKGIEYHTSKKKKSHIEYVVYKKTNLTDLKTFTVKKTTPFC